MSLIYCPDCGKQVSEFANNCPNCGYPIVEKLTELKNTLEQEAAVAEANAESEKKAETNVVAKVLPQEEIKPRKKVRKKTKINIVPYIPLGIAVILFVVLYTRTINFYTILAAVVEIIIGLAIAFLMTFFFVKGKRKSQKITKLSVAFNVGIISVLVALNVLYILKLDAVQNNIQFGKEIYVMANMKTNLYRNDDIQKSNDLSCRLKIRGKWVQDGDVTRIKISSTVVERIDCFYANKAKNDGWENVPQKTVTSLMVDGYTQTEKIDIASDKYVDVVYYFNRVYPFWEVIFE